MSRRLERSTTDRVITGVCGGLAHYLSIDSTFVRIFFVICAIVTAGVFILVYIALLLLLPLPGERAPMDGLIPGLTTSAPPSPSDPAAEGAAPPVPHNDAEAADRRRAAFGYILVTLGLIFLASSLGAFRFVQWQYVWPLVLVGLGVLLLVRR